MDRKKVLLATPHLWDAPYKVGSHQYAKCFADKGWEVAYVSTPISPFHVLYHLFSSQRAKVLLPERWRSWARGGEQFGDIWTYVPFGLIPIANMCPFNRYWAIEHAGRFLFPPLKRKLRGTGFGEVDTIWLDSPLFGYLLDVIPHRKSVLRIADELSGFPELGPNIMEAERRLIKKVDLVVATARELVDKAAGFGAKKTLLLPNGVDFGRFAEDRSGIPAELASIPCPRVTYVGSIEHWFSEEWVAYSAARLPDVSFVIIGKYAKGSFPALERLPNVFLLGKRSYPDIPSYLKHSQAGMIPFKKLPFIEAVNPIKLYEYMACGLPVVSTRWKALEEISSPAFLADTKEEFAHLLRNALVTSPEQKEGFVRFARENSWAKRLELVTGYLE
ncbi:MAG: glycosyltransferase [Nitrospirota bacterium]|nr:glycosyltransferase [Nitrospirota bacterium]